MQTNFNENYKMLILNQINITKSNIKNSIFSSFQNLIKAQNSISKIDLEKWLNNIINNHIIPEIDKLSSLILNNKSIDKSNEIITIKEYKIESKNGLNIFTSKDVQEENKEITRNFQTEAYNYMNTQEKVENQNIANFLIKAAKISRISFNVSQKILKMMKEKYIKLKKA